MLIHPLSIKGEKQIFVWKTGEVPLCSVYYFVLSAVQRMAQAHLSSLDMTSVDNEEPSSGEEGEEAEKKNQQTDSAPGA